MTDDKMIDASFEVSFTVSLEVRNVNDAVINQQKVVQAAKDAAWAECQRQLSESKAAGDFDVG